MPFASWRILRNTAGTDRCPCGTPPGGSSSATSTWSRLSPPWPGRGWCARCGYLLTRAPEEYTVGEILRPLEGDLAPVECATDRDFCQRSRECVTVELWQDIHRAVAAVVDGTTLADLIARRQARQGEAGEM